MTAISSTLQKPSLQDIAIDLSRKMSLVPSFIPQRNKDITASVDLSITPISSEKKTLPQFFLDSLTTQETLSGKIGQDIEKNFQEDFSRLKKILMDQSKNQTIYQEQAKKSAAWQTFQSITTVLSIGTTSALVLAGTISPALFAFLLLPQALSIGSTIMNHTDGWKVIAEKVSKNPENIEHNAHMMQNAYTLFSLIISLEAMGCSLSTLPSPTNIQNIIDIFKTSTTLASSTASIGSALSDHQLISTQKELLLNKSDTHFYQHMTEKNLRSLLMLAEAQSEQRSKAKVATDQQLKLYEISGEISA